MMLGPYEGNPPLMLAPMAGITDLPFRTICRSFGAAYAVAEMTASRSDLREKAKSLTRWVEERENGFRVVQLLGADPAVMADAARAAEDAGADVVDINMGCPAKKVLSSECGSALLRDEARVARILEAVVGAVSIPVTLKIRTGWSPEKRNAARIAEIAQDAGIAMLVVHGRTRADGFRGEAEYATIRAVNANSTIPIVANGDISSGSKALDVMRYTGADGVMIGRGALGRPWVFAEAASALRGESAPPAVTPSHIRSTVLRHMGLHFAYYGGRRFVASIRKHLTYYLRHLPDPARRLPELLRERAPMRQTALVEAFFDALPTDPDEPLPTSKELTI